MKRHVHWGHVKWIVSAIWDRAITLSQKKWFVLFWMRDFIALTRCCKLISFLHLIFAVLLPNLIRPIVKKNVCHCILRVTWLRHAAFPENVLPRPLGFQRRSYVPSLKSLTQVVLKLCLFICQKFRGHVTDHARLGKVIYASSLHSICELATDQIWCLQPK